MGAMCGSEPQSITSEIKIGNLEDLPTNFKISEAKEYLKLLGQQTGCQTLLNFIKQKKRFFIYQPLDKREINGVKHCIEEMQNIQIFQKNLKDQIQTMQFELKQRIQSSDHKMKEMEIRFKMEKPKQLMEGKEFPDAAPPNKQNKNKRNKKKSIEIKPQQKKGFQSGTEQENYHNETPKSEKGYQNEGYRMSEIDVKINKQELMREREDSDLIKEDEAEHKQSSSFLEKKQITDEKEINRLEEIIEVQKDQIISLGKEILSLERKLQHEIKVGQKQAECNENLKKQYDELKKNQSKIKKELALQNNLILNHESILSLDSTNSVKNYNILQALCKICIDSRILPLKHNFSLGQEIRKTIQSFFIEKEIRQSNLLFFHDEIFPNHHEHYIKNRQNLFVLMKLENQKIIGGFTGKEGNNKEIEKSFLFSITPQNGQISQSIVLTASKPVKNICHDPNYLSFGDLKVKAKSKSCSTNIAGFGAVYKSDKGKYGVKEFFGLESRNFEVTGYEIYELFFEGELMND